jgi:hypothetical protein
MRATNVTVPRRGVVAAALALILIALAGCGGSSSSSLTKKAAAGTATTGTAVANSAADQRVARNAELRLTDFPAGWGQSATAQATGQSPCQSVEGAKAATSVRDTSRDFSNGRDVPAAYSAVYLYGNATNAGHWFDDLSSSATRSCLAEVLAKGLARGVGAKIGAVTTGGVAIDSIGDERSEARLTIPVSADGSSSDLRADLIFVRVNRAVAILTLLDTVRPFSQPLAERLTRGVVDRLRAGLHQTMS